MDAKLAEPKPADAKGPPSDEAPKKKAGRPTKPKPLENENLKSEGTITTNFLNLSVQQKRLDFMEGLLQKQYINGDLSAFAELMEKALKDSEKNHCMIQLLIVDSPKLVLNDGELNPPLESFRFLMNDDGVVAIALQHLSQVQSSTTLLIWIV